MKHLKILLVTFLAVCSAPAWAVEALEFSGGEDYIWPGATIGWEFSISEEITVTALGVFDSDQDGFEVSHQVGIFPAGVNSPIVTTTVQTGDPLDDGFRYAPIPPQVLTPGNYVIAARMPDTDDDLDQGFSFTSYSTALPVTYVKEWFLYSDNFELPTDDWSADGGNFGPNFRFNEDGFARVTEPVPSLSAWMVAILAALFGLFAATAIARRGRA